MTPTHHIFINEVHNTGYVQDVEIGDYIFLVNNNNFLEKVIVTRNFKVCALQLL